MDTVIKDFDAITQDGSALPVDWRAKVVINDDNLTYVAWNERSQEAIVVDPMREDWDALVSITHGELKGYRFVAVIDTHTHADHVSCAAALAERLSAPLIQHELSPSKRVHLRVSRDTVLPSAVGPLTLLVTPGHTGECITPIWGPWVFGGDTVLYGDTGRDDLPGGDPEAHWDSLQKLKAHLTREHFLAPGHDSHGGRASHWGYQLDSNPSLYQDKQTFLADAGAYVGPAPKILKESLYENFK